MNIKSLHHLQSFCMSFWFVLVSFGSLSYFCAHPVFIFSIFICLWSLFVFLVKLCFWGLDLFAILCLLVFFCLLLAISNCLRPWSLPFLVFLHLCGDFCWPNGPSRPVQLSCGVMYAVTLTGLMLLCKRCPHCKLCFCCCLVKMFMLLIGH